MFKLKGDIATYQLITSYYLNLRIMPPAEFEGAYYTGLNSKIKQLELRIKNEAAEPIDQIRACVLLIAVLSTQSTLYLNLRTSPAHNKKLYSLLINLTGRLPKAIRLNLKKEEAQIELCELMMCALKHHNLYFNRYHSERNAFKGPIPLLSLYTSNIHYVLKFVSCVTDFNAISESFMSMSSIWLDYAGLRPEKGLFSQLSEPCKVFLKKNYSLQEMTTANSIGNDEYYQFVLSTVVQMRSSSFSSQSDELKGRLAGVLTKLNSIKSTLSLEENYFQEQELKSYLASYSREPSSGSVSQSPVAVKMQLSSR